MKSNRKNTRTLYIRPTIDWSREYDRDLAESVRKYAEQWKKKNRKRESIPHSTVNRPAGTLD